MQLCPVCGNEHDRDQLSCPYCGSDLNNTLIEVGQQPVLHRTINLEKGRPLVENALKRLDSELQLARSARVRVLTIIHGYGSSGRGGKIRNECRKVLDHLVEKQQLNLFIPGEGFHRREGAGKALLRRFPQLEAHCSSDFNNPGVTLVVL